MPSILDPSILTNFLVILTLSHRKWVFLKVKMSGPLSFKLFFRILAIKNVRISMFWFLGQWGVRGSKVSAFSL